MTVRSGGSSRPTRIITRSSLYHLGSCAPGGLLDETGAARYTIHQLRHTTATELLEEGHKIGTVQRRRGHKDIRATMGYAEISAAAVRAELEGKPRR